jgi:hypothetical protein
MKCVIMRHVILLFAIFIKMKKDEIGGACGTNRIGEKCVQNIGRESRKKETLYQSRVSVRG